MKQVNLIVVGKLKDKNLELIEAEFIKRINEFSLQIFELKANAESPIAEGEEILKKLKELSLKSPVYPIALTEYGKEYSSVEFSEWFYQLLENDIRPTFIISGAEKFSPEVLKICKTKISLSKLTFPHKIARILLVEQLYRSMTIKKGHPYHN
jgi:23S rRNA (pseudouridine1915-N3)-methyltransferase